MKKNLSLSRVLAVVLAAMLMLGCAAFAEGEVKDTVILFTSDVHCGVDQGWTYTGLYGLKQQLAATNDVVLVDNGDSIQGEALGAITKGDVDVNLMNALGYDIAIPGNHEFDYGMDRFLDIVNNQAQYPYISCNFALKDEPVLAPYIIKDLSGMKVAFVGISTPETFTKSTPTYFQDENGNFIYDFANDTTGEKLYATVQKAVDAARAEGAQIVVALAHLGIDEASSPWMSTQVIAATNGIDVMLDGHSHSILEQEKVLNKDGAEVLLSACGTKLQAIGYCKITADGQISTGLYQWNQATDIVSMTGLTNEFSPIMAEQTDSVNAMLAEVVAHTDVDLIINDPTTGARIIRNLESNLGDLVADAYRASTGADVALVNGGGIRANIPAGDITLEQIKACHPFGNMLCMVEANGQQILDALEWTSRAVPGENGGFLQVSGLTYEINTAIPSSAQQDEYGMFAGVTGEYRVQNVMVGGEPLDVNKTYTVASHNYMLKSGGDGTNMFIGDTVLIDETKFDYQTVIDYIVDTLGGSVGEDYADLWGQGRIIIK